MKTIKKISDWIFKSKVDLSKKWWHRLLKVLFIILIIASSIYGAMIIVDSYADITHNWKYETSLSERLSDESFSGEVFSVNDLYSANEIISDEPSYSMNYSLDDKKWLSPTDLLFAKDPEETFCSDELHNHASKIAEANNVYLFSNTTPSLNELYADVDVFTSYLISNSYRIKCLIIDRYSSYTAGSLDYKYTFLRPIDTFDYHIYEYENNLSEFILYVVGSILFSLIYILIAILIYYKAILYIIYGKFKG